MKKIKLTKGQVALVSDHRFEELNKYRWYAQWNEQTQTYYAARTEKGRRILMHRQIMGDPKGMIVDHRNHRTLNNQDHNLRVVTHSQSMMNRRVSKSNRLGIKNISIARIKSGGRIYEYFRVAIEAEHKPWIKTFSDLGVAIAVRDLKLKELHGEYACGSGCA